MDFAINFAKASSPKVLKQASSPTQDAKVDVQLVALQMPARMLTAGLNMAPLTISLNNSDLSRKDNPTAPRAHHTVTRLRLEAGLSSGLAVDADTPNCGIVLAFMANSRLILVPDNSRL